MSGECNWRKEEIKKVEQGGKIMGIRKEIVEKGTKIETDKEGTIVGGVKQGREC